eukprot:TRINITY_DN1269_c2_g1_i1.p1 TRINITY_DN1269_c2_g1~~TRINITY_DN1269_c2_g1_i1.p1  ORF type:complete len:182 (-),score=77.40 TRINITY_DN1269_c2_g1_i1:166-711(-)
MEKLVIGKILLVLFCFIIPLIHASPFIVARKNFVQSELVKGKDAIISIQVFNLGESPAYDLTINDTENWGAETFKVVIGFTSVSIDKLEAGANISNSFIVRPNNRKIFDTIPAVVLFRETPNGPLIYSYSSAFYIEKIKNRSELERLSSAHLFEWTVFIGIFCLASFPAFTSFKKYTQKSN